MRLFKAKPNLSVCPSVLRAYQSIAEAVGDTNFDDRVCEAIQSVNCVARWYFFEWNQEVGEDGSQSDSDYSMYAFQHEKGLDFQRYQSEYLYRDPFQVVLPKLPKDEAVVAVEVTPSDLDDQSFRRMLMDDFDIVQRVSFVHATLGRSRIFSVGRSTAHGSLSGAAIEQLGALSALVFPLMQCHKSIVSSRNTIHLDQLEMVVLHHFPRLTRREAQVCARTIVGRSSKTIARELGIGPESVATYRKRAYVRTGANTIEQLSKSILG